MTIPLFFGLLGLFMAVDIAALLMLLREESKNEAEARQLKDRIAKEEETIAGNSELQQQVKTLGEKNKELSQALSAREEGYKELKDKYETLKARLLAEEARKPAAQPAEPIKTDDAGGEKPPDGQVRRHMEGGIEYNPPESGGEKQ